MYAILFLSTFAIVAAVFYNIGYRVASNDLRFTLDKAFKTLDSTTKIRVYTAIANARYSERLEK